MKEIILQNGIPLELSGAVCLRSIIADEKFSLSCGMKVDLVDKEGKCKPFSFSIVRFYSQHSYQNNVVSLVYAIFAEKIIITYTGKNDRVRLTYDQYAD